MKYELFWVSLEYCGQSKRKKLKKRIIAKLRYVECQNDFLIQTCQLQVFYPKSEIIEHNMCICALLLESGGQQLLFIKRSPSENGF